MNICSLVPGATEVVAALGLEHQLVGVSHECDFPPNVAHVPVMLRERRETSTRPSGELPAHTQPLPSADEGPYELVESRLLTAKPDLLITQNFHDAYDVTPAQLARVMRALSPPPRLLTLNPKRLDDILRDIETLGAAMGREEAGHALATRLRDRLNAVRLLVRTKPTRPRVACLGWLSPLYSAGHWVPDMVDAAGGTDALSTAGMPSQKIEWDALTACAPEVIVLMPCGFTVARTKAKLATIARHPQWGTLPAVQRGEVYAVNAPSYFSRPGPRLFDGIVQLSAIFHPSCYGYRLPAAVERLTMPQTSTPMT